MRNLENMQLWVRALLSGEFEQGSGALNSNNKYCCLGVACEVARRNGVDVTAKSPYINSKLISYDDKYYFLPDTVKEWLGVANEDPIIFHDDEKGPILASMANDYYKWDFRRIAEALVEYYGLSED